jgi:hypothetical protein
VEHPAAHRERCDGLVMIAGDVDIGNTRLARELEHHATARGAAVL